MGSSVEGLLLTVHLCPSCNGAGVKDKGGSRWECCGRPAAITRTGVVAVTRFECFSDGNCTGMIRKTIKEKCERCDGRRWVWRDQAVTHAILQGEVEPDSA